MLHDNRTPTAGRSVLDIGIGSGGHLVTPRPPHYGGPKYGDASGFRRSPRALERSVSGVVREHAKVACRCCAWLNAGIVMIASMSEPPKGASPVSSRTPLTVRIQPPWIAPVALVIAVIAVAVAVWALLRPAPASSTPAPTGQQTADAKSRACTAFNVVHTAVQLQTHADLGTDPVAVQTVAANARLATAAGGWYLLARLDPATPADLAAAIRSFANDLQDISMYEQAGVSSADPTLSGRLRDGEAASTQIAGLCR
jgi:hypothetical protein